MVVLDAQDDWRFARNVRAAYLAGHDAHAFLQPLVIGHPHIRFYAGCPLRTHDGFNIGT